jgi:hypothetical protein
VLGWCLVCCCCLLLLLPEPTILMLLLCLDFVVMVGWVSYAPEVEFLEKLRAIDGVSQVEEQTFTLAEL